MLDQKLGLPLRVVLALQRQSDVVRQPQPVLVAPEAVFYALPVTAAKLIRGTAVQ